MRLPLLTNRSDTLWYKEGRVFLLDRRLYPKETVYRDYGSYQEVAQAIIDMVVQGAPPLAYTAGYGLALAAREAQRRFENIEKQKEYVKEAYEVLLNTRPTGADLYQVLSRALDTALKSLSQGEDAEKILVSQIDAEVQRGDYAARVSGYYAATLMGEEETILTHCFPGAALNYLLYYATKMGKEISVYANETRPYFQGLRLTAASVSELGLPVTVVTDGMAGYLFKEGKITKYITAADSVLMNGSIVNKIGTYQYAIVAKYHEIPYIVLGYDGPDVEKEVDSDIRIEERNPEEILSFKGERLVGSEIKAYYPAFDLTPGSLVSAICTDRGIFSPLDIKRYLLTKDHDPVPLEL